MDGGRFDLFVIGGGINGAALARDAAGRGLSVFLAEAGDYACGTSSASSKLIHGGLRYLELGALRLVRESLRERALLLRMAPHLVRPMRFLLPVSADAGRSPTVLRLGLFLYDVLARRGGIAASGRLPSEEAARLIHLKPELRVRVFQYSDCLGDDSRLVIETLMDARRRGADIGNYRKVTHIRPHRDGFAISVAEGGRTQYEVHARFVANMAGAWVNEVVTGAMGAKAKHALRLVRGSHLVLNMPSPAFTDGFLLQNPDKRVIFVIPWLSGKRLLIGTTDVDHRGPLDEIACSPAERAYLLESYNRYFTPARNDDDIVASFAGLRALIDIPGRIARKLSRDYLIDIDSTENGAFITVYGGKLTTHRALAETIMAHITKLAATRTRDWTGPWTAKEPLPGAPGSGLQTAGVSNEPPAGVASASWARWLDTYGVRSRHILALLAEDPVLAHEIAPGVSEAELIFARDAEDARSAEDFLFRRTHLGYLLPPMEQEKIALWFSRSLKP
jgi:glycerol-3-phosphate dehydrogenase